MSNTLIRFISCAAIFIGGLSLAFLSQQKGLFVQEAHALSNVSFIFGVGNPGDGLGQGWSVLPTTANTANTTPVYAGIHSLSYTASAHGQTIDFRSSSPIDLTQYNYIIFFAQPALSGVNYTISLLATNGNPTGTALPIESYGDPLAPGTWSSFAVPIADFQASGTDAGGVRFTEANGTLNSAFYLDEVALYYDTGPSDASPSAVPEPYSPQINPFVFLVPIIAFFLFIFFR